MQHSGDQSDAEIGVTRPGLCSLKRQHIPSKCHRSLKEHTGLRNEAKIEAEDSICVGEGIIAVRFRGSHA